MKWFALVMVCLGVSGCSREPTMHATKLTGSDAAVAGLPHHRAADRFVVQSCCTLKLGPGNREEKLQGTDSIIYKVSGPGYVLHVVFGPFDTGEPLAGFAPTGKSLIDDVELTSFRWPDQNPKPRDGRLLWLAQVGGGMIKGVEHTPWGLRIMGDCDTPAACRASAAVVDTIRF